MAISLFLHDLKLGIAKNKKGKATPLSIHAIVHMRALSEAICSVNPSAMKIAQLRGRGRV